MAIKEHIYNADLGGAIRPATTLNGQPLNEISVPSTTGGEPVVWKVVDVANWPTVRYEVDTLPATVSADLAHAGVTKTKANREHVTVPDFAVPDIEIPEMSAADSTELSADGIPDQTGSGSNEGDFDQPDSGSASPS